MMNLPHFVLTTTRFPMIKQKSKCKKQILTFYGIVDGAVQYHILKIKVIFSYFWIFALK
jgi:hypothetical protein